MPGTKIEMKVGDDPDPAPFLFVNEEIKARIAAKVYDPKRSAYVPHPEEKYVEVGPFSNQFFYIRGVCKKKRPVFIVFYYEGGGSAEK